MKLRADSKISIVKISIILVLILVSIIIFMLILLGSNSEKLVGEVSKDLSERYAREINALMTTNVDITIQAFEDEALLIEDALNNMGELDYDAAVSFLGYIHDNSDYYLGLVTENGMLYDSNGKNVGTTLLPFIEDLFNSDTYISDNVSLRDNTYVMFGHRLEGNVTVEGFDLKSIVIGITNEMLASRAKLSSEYSNSFSSIIQKDGTFIVKNSMEKQEGRNEFTILALDGGISQFEIQNVKNAIEYNLPYLLLSEQMETPYYIYFSPMAYSNWVLVNHIPQEFVGSAVKDIQFSITATSTLVIAIISALFVAMLIAFIVIMSRLYQNRNALNKALEEAKEANKAKTTFLNNMSHDIRTPMNAITGLVAIARSQNDNEQVDRTLAKIKVSSNYLLSLINDILDISRIESGRTELNLQTTILETISANVLSIVGNTISDRDIKLQVTRDLKSKTYVLADELRIQEVLINILSNAVKFTPDGGSISFTETRTLDFENNRVDVTYIISDTGIGMSEDFLKRLFGEFEQENNGARTKYKGTGLGMAITKRLVDLMGGDIQVVSEKDIGTTFTVKLPLEASQRKDDDVSREKISKFSLEGIKVLLAEDNDLNAEIAEFMLKENGITVTRVSDGEEALKAFRDNPPDTFDAVLMDIMMPNLDGYEATRIIRELPRNDARHIPIIAMTANAFEEDKQNALDAGMDGHISKPIDMYEMAKTIKKCMLLHSNNN